MSYLANIIAVLLMVVVPYMHACDCLPILADCGCESGVEAGNEAKAQANTETHCLLVGQASNSDSATEGKKQNNKPVNNCEQVISLDLDAALLEPAIQLHDIPSVILIAPVENTNGWVSTPAVIRSRNLSALPPPISIIVVTTQFLRV